MHDLKLYICQMIELPRDLMHLQYQRLNYRFVHVGSNMHKRNELYMLSKIWKQRQMVQKFSRKSFQKFPKLLNLRNANNSTESNRISGSKVEWKETSAKKNSKVWVYLARLSSFMAILVNTVAFATESCRKFKPDVLG